MLPNILGVKAPVYNELGNEKCGLEPKIETHSKPAVA
jgi:hypothetical protein